MLAPSQHSCLNSNPVTMYCWNSNWNCMKIELPIRQGTFVRHHHPAPVDRYWSIDCPLANWQPIRHMQQHLPAHRMVFVRCPIGKRLLSAGHCRNRWSLGQCSPTGSNLRRMCMSPALVANTSDPTVSRIVRPDTVDQWREINVYKHR